MSRDNSPIETLVYINEVDVTEYVLPNTSWEREWLENISTAVVSVNKKINDVLTINDVNGIGYNIRIMRGVDQNSLVNVFRGFIHKVNLNGNELVLSCKDKLYRTIKKRITTSFDRNINPEQGVISEIVKTLLTRYTDLDFDDDTIINTGTTITLGKFEAKRSELFERLTDLADSVNYQFYYNPVDDKVHFEPKGFIVSEQVLTVGEEIVITPQWSINDSYLVNSLTVEGATQEYQENKFFNGDNSEGQVFQLDFIPVSVKVFVGSGTFDVDAGSKPSDNNSNLKIGGRKGSTDGSYDYEYDDDPQVKNLIFFDSDNGEQPSFTPPVGVDNVEIQYSYDLPVPVSGKRQSSIDTYGLYEDTLTKTDIKSVGDAEVYLEKYLDYFAEPFISDTVRVDGLPIVLPGHQHLVVDGVNDVERELLVTKVKSFYPYRSDEVTVGDEEFTLQTFEVKVWDRVKRLEEKSSKTSDFLIQAFSFNVDEEEKSRYFKLLKKNIAGETGIYGNPQFGLYGVSKYGSLATSSFILGNTSFGELGVGILGDTTSEDVTVKLFPGNNVFEEYLYDAEFFDESLSSGAIELDTDNMVLYVSPGAVYVSKPLSIGVPYTRFNVDFNNIVNIGNLRAEVSWNDGVDWLVVSGFNNNIDFPEAASVVRLKLVNEASV